MKVLVTGGAGFIGSHAVDALLAKGHGVTALDNLSGGKKEFIARHMDNPKFRFVHNDLLDRANIRDALKGHDAVWHLAAKPDVRTYTAEDLEKDVRITENVLDAMAKSGVRRIIFSSSSAVYGEAKQVPTPEDAPLRPISKYGESKVACERLVSKYCSEQGARCWIFRFANIVGERGTHGVIVDFINKLRKNPSELEILGDGRQSKSYLLVQDCIIGMMMGVEKSNDTINTFNLGCEDWVSIRADCRNRLGRDACETSVRIYGWRARVGWRCSKNVIGDRQDKRAWLEANTRFRRSCQRGCQGVTRHLKIRIRLY